MKRITAVSVFMFFILTHSTAFAESKDLHIVCGDTDHAYVSMDLSPSFLADYYSNEKVDAFNKQGFRHSFAGRNCSLDSSQGAPQFDILFLMKREKHLFRDVFRPFNIASADLYLSTTDSNVLENGVILTGTSDSLETSDRVVRGKLSAPRTSSRDEMIIIIRNHSEN